MAASSHGLKSTILLLQVATMAGNDTWAMSSNKHTWGKAPTSRTAERSA